MRFGILISVLTILLTGFVLAEGETAGTQEATVCCQKTNSGLFCQDVLEEDCAADTEFALPTACASTTPCDPGYCYDKEEGTCLDNVPHMVCNEEGGFWSAEKPPVCDLGCCVLADQGAFVTQARCKRLSSFYGLETNWNPEIESEAQCILEAKAEEKGACVFEEDFEKGFETTCKMVTRSECTSNVAPAGETETDLDAEENTEEESENTEGNESIGDILGSPAGCETVSEGVRFCPGFLCSAPELGTNCGPSEQTTCVEGEEEVYFVDTCGNLANIYDASKIRDTNYWSYIKDKAESCKPGDSNINSPTCGNCNYLVGSFCGEAGTVRPTYGNNICIDLNCEASEMTNGVARLHGESWCGFDVNREFSFQENSQNVFSQLFDGALRDVRANNPINPAFRGSSAPVGSKFYRYVCSHGEVIVEPCADFRQEECIENNVAGYSEAACRVNRWQDCTTVFTKLDCENSDRRDCVWMDGIEYVLLGGLANGSTLDKSSLGAAREELKKFRTGDRELGACVPKNPPGLQFWGTEDSENTEAAAICAQANAVCPVTYEKGLVGGDWECVENCECLEQETQLQRAQLCMALGDCGPKVNYQGQAGKTTGYKIFEQELGDN